MLQSVANIKPKREILMYGVNYPPEEIRAGRFMDEIGSYLAKRGYGVTVVTAQQNYSGQRGVPPLHTLSYATEKRNGIKFLRCPMLVHFKVRRIWRLIAPLSFAMTSAPLALWQMIRTRPAHILCIDSTLLIAPIAILGRVLGARVTLHVQDFKIDAAFTGGQLKRGQLKNFASRAESWLLRQFTNVITNSGQMRKRLIAKGVEASRIEVVPNCVDLHQMKPLDGPNGFRRDLGLSDVDFVILYAGDASAKPALEVVLTAVQLISAKHDAHLVIVADGQEMQRIMRDCSDLRRIHFLPLQPEERLCELWNLADLHVLAQPHGVADPVFSEKLAELLASGKPLLVTADVGTEIVEVLNGVAIFVPTDDSGAMATEIERLIADGWHPALGDVRNLTQSFARDAFLEKFFSCLKVTAY